MFNFLNDERFTFIIYYQEKGDYMDTLETIKCPACGKEMEKILIPSEGINIDICTNGCGGIFFDNREFDKFNEEHENIDAIQEKLHGKTFTPTDEDAIRICPACGGQMVKNTTTNDGEVVVDDCYICGGKFLDHGELEKIRAEFKNDKERKEATIDFLFDKVGYEIKEIDETLAQRKAKRNLGQKLFYSILKLD